VAFVVRWYWSLSRVGAKSTIPVAVLLVVAGGTSCAPVSVATKTFTPGKSSWPRISPFGRSALCTLT
jgi:hypothetical protein